MDDQHDLEVLIASRLPIIAVESYEETRVLALLERCSRGRNWPLFAWSAADGLIGRGGAGALPETSEPTAALRFIDRSAVPGVYALLDFHPFLGNPINVRLLKKVATEYERVPRTLIMVGYQVTVPPECEKLSARFTLQLPDRDAIKAIVKEEVQTWQKRSADAEVRGEREIFDVLLRHLSGLCEADVRRLIRQAIDDDGVLNRDDIDRLVKCKHDLMGEQGVLSFEMDTARFSDVAGLANLKNWLDRRRDAFLGDPAENGLDVPKGIMLLGVQGCGKSLAAKAVAGAWSVPLMRLDFGALYNKFLGETERNLREALKVADAMAPCVLWMDEIEKGVASSGNNADGGESRRILGTLLTWMAERKSQVFIVATSNDIEALPPELVRKGRLDEIFFVDLPNESARGEVFRIHLQRRHQDAAQFDMAALTAASAGFSGAEIEQAVVAALYEARAGKVPLVTAHLLAEIGKTKPLSVVMAERIAYLRVWAAERTVKAD